MTWRLQMKRKIDPKALTSDRRGPRQPLRFTTTHGGAGVGRALGTQHLRAREGD